MVKSKENYNDYLHWAIDKGKHYIEANGVTEYYVSKIDPYAEQNFLLG
jgi:hypothetical protein